MIDRKNLSTILGLALSIRLPKTKQSDVEQAIYNADHLVIYQRDTLEIVASISKDGLYDPDGSYFHDDA